MNTRAIGSLQVSEVGVGCNNFGSRLDQERANDVVNAALEAGVNFFDTADTYGATQSEVFLGKALGARRAGGGRDQVRHADRRHALRRQAAYVKSACEDSLRRLDTDYIDLYQLHYPDDTTPIADTLGAFSDLVAAGKVREIGCSNFSADQMRAATAAAGAGAAFVSVQNQYSLARTRSREGRRAGGL